MKTRSCISKLAVIFGAALVCAWSAAAEDMNLHVTMNMDSTAGASTNGIYLSGDAGLAFMQNMTSQGNVIQYHVGPRFDVSAGYNLRRNIAVELQGGFAHNSWSAVNSRSIPPGGSANVWTVPVMANGIYKYSFNRHWQAYGGLGAGVLISTLNISTPVASSSSADCGFGYQAMVGISDRFDENLEWGLGYSFVGSLDHHWNDLGRGITTGPTYLHSFLVHLTYRF